MAFVSDELLVAESPAAITIWNVRTRRLVRLILAKGYMAISPVRQLVVARDFFNNIGVWRIPSGEEVGSIDARKFGGVLGPSFSPDGRFLAGGEIYFPDVRDKKFVQIWRVGDEIEDWQVARILAIPLGREYGLLGVIGFSPDGKLLAITAFNGGEVVVQLWYVGDLQ